MARARKKGGLGLRAGVGEGVGALRVRDVMMRRAFLGLLLGRVSVVRFMVR